MFKKFQWGLMCCLMLALVWLIKIPETNAASNYLIEINKATNQLILYQNGIKYKTYSVATGKTDDRTPEGTFHMVVKIKQPGWKHIPGGAPDNPLGDRWLGISVNGDRGREYGIHGTIDPASIGTYASNGCVRMRQNDLHELYNLVPETTPVWIHKGTTNDHWRGDASYTVQPMAATTKIKNKVAVAYTGPSTGAFEMKKLKKGTTVQITGHSKSWYRIKLDNKNAYLAKNEGHQYQTEKILNKPFQSHTGTIETTVNLANIRSAPLMTGAVTQRLNQGVKMTFTGESQDWFRVRLETGYIAYVHKSVAKGIEQPAPKSETLTVQKNRVNVRSSTSHYAPVLQTVEAGKTFQTVGLNGEWYIIPASPTQTGFIHKTLAK